MLELKHINKITGLNVDYFKPGHPQALRGAWIPLLGEPRALGGEGVLPRMIRDGKNQPQVSARSSGGKQGHCFCLCNIMRCADS